MEEELVGYFVGFTLILLGISLIISGIVSLIV